MYITRNIWIKLYQCYNALPYTLILNSEKVRLRIHKFLEFLLSQEIL